MEGFEGIAIGLAYVVLAVVVLIVARLCKDLLTPFKLGEELTVRDNPAIGVATAGYFAGVIIVFLGSAVGPHVEGDVGTGDLLTWMAIDLVYALGGILALNVGRIIVDKLVLYRFSTVKEIVEDRNVGTGAVECGSYVATGLVIAGACQGEGDHALSALIFFVLGQAVLAVFALFYQWITRYDIHDEIEKDNTAAGVALGGSMIAMGILLFRAALGQEKAGLGADGDWAVALGDFAYYAGLGFILLMVLRKVVDVMILPKTTIAHEIANDRNLNAAWLEATIAMGMATVITFMI